MNPDASGLVPFENVHAGHGAAAPLTRERHQHTGQREGDPGRALTTPGGS